MKQSIFIRKLIVEGEDYKRTFPFYEGLNIISGDRYTGKSLTLKLIDYCLGKSGSIDFNVQKELGMYCNRVYLQIDILGITYTIRRDLKKLYTRIYVYYCAFDDISLYIPQKMEYGELSKFIFDKLQVPEFKLERHIKHDTRKTLETISFRDVMRYVYIDQHELGTNNFLHHKDSTVSYKNKPTFQLLHSLIYPDLDNINQQIVDTKNSIENLKKEIDGLSLYLKERDAEDRAILEAQLKETSDAIGMKIKEKQEFLRRVNDKKATSNHIYNRLKAEVVKLNDLNFELEKKEKELKFNIGGKQNLLNDYEKEYEQLLATKEIMYHIKLDQHNHQCPLCRSYVATKDKPVENIETVDLAIEQLNGKMKMIKSVIENDKHKIDEVYKEIRLIDEQKKVFEKALNEYSVNVETPFLSEVESLNSLITSFRNKENILNDCIGVHNKIGQKYFDIRTLEGLLEQLENQKNNLKIEKSREIALMDYINDKYRALLRKFDFNTNSNTDYVDPEDYTPYYQGASVFSHESGGLLMCMQIAYLCAILCKKYDDAELRHPGFLMLDSVGKYLGTNVNARDRIDPKAYEAIYTALIVLSKYFQIFVVDNTPPNKVSRYIRYTFLKDGKGFIDLSANEV